MKLWYFESARTLIFDVNIDMPKKSCLQIQIKLEFILNFKVPSYDVLLHGCCSVVFLNKKARSQEKLSLYLTRAEQSHTQDFFCTQLQFCAVRYQKKKR